jgi:hypothetical protein
MFPGVSAVGLVLDGFAEILLSTESRTKLALWTLFGL